MKKVASYISCSIKAKGKKIFLLFLGLSCLFFNDFVATDRRAIAETEKLPTNISEKTSNLNISLQGEDLNEIVPEIENNWKQEYEEYLGIKIAGVSMTAEEIAVTLEKIGRQTGKKPALLYMVPRPEGLELVLITPGNKPIHKSIAEAPRETLLKVAKNFGNTIKNPAKRNTNEYLQPARELYEWAIAPVEADLQAQNIETILFCVGAGLRSLPLAALHDGKQFLVEKYSMSRIPAFTLTDTIYADLRSARVLAMGASKFTELSPLPAVPAELNAIAKKIWQGDAFLNEAFTLDNLQEQRQKQSYQIIHLSTHAEFKTGEASNSFIQFWDSKLTLDAMRNLGWNNPPVELLVLSACRTAIGDEQAELGFAGLAVQAGVKSAVASLWYVSDEGTLALMTEFYQYLRTAPIKAEALRQAQIAMIRGKVRLQNGEVQGSAGNVSLPPELREIQNENLSHPYYWAAFSLIGSPW